MFSWVRSLIEVGRIMQIESGLSNLAFDANRQLNPDAVNNAFHSANYEKNACDHESRRSVHQLDSRVADSQD
ncbi:hypothetical protein N9B17_03765 [Rhodopirellula sp.]|nr:hypothetical protein [Rhodopirellula sp.]